jgi:hypothetical protein
VANYSPVFSAAFIVQQPSASNTHFEVPPGFTAVVRDFTVACLYGGTLTSLYIQDSSVAPAVTIAYLEVAGVGQSAQWQGRIVVPENGFISVYIADLSSGANTYVGGYLLRNVAA